MVWGSLFFGHVTIDNVQRSPDLQTSVSILVIVLFSTVGKSNRSPLAPSTRRSAASSCLQLLGANYIDKHDSLASWATERFRHVVQI